MSKNIVLQGHDEIRICVSPEAIALRDSLIADASQITSVTTVEQQQQALRQAGKIKGVTKQVEADRVAVGSPLRTFINTINQEAATIQDPLNAEVKRLERLASDFALLEKQRIERERKAEEDRIRAEQDRIRRGREEAERKERERIAAIEKAEAEKARQAREEQDKVKRAKLEEEARQLRELKEKEERDAILAREFEEPEVVPQLPQPVEPTKIAGARVEPKFDFEVVDLVALFNAHPECVKLEAKRREIADLVRLGNREIPGVRVFEVVGVTARATVATHTIGA